MTTKQETLAEIVAKDDFAADERTSTGAPTTDAVNARMPEGSETVTATERNDAWAAYQEALPAKDESTETGATSVDGTGKPRDPSEPTPAQPPNIPQNDPEAEPEATSAPDSKKARIKVTRAFADPVPVTIHGVGSFSLPVGKETTVPREAIDALRDSDVQFEEL